MPSIGEASVGKPSAMATSPESPPLRVFVHLAHNKDADKWRRDRALGRLVGVNDETPYGYGRADTMGCRVEFSRAGRETLLGTFVRLAVRVLAGFDFVHAWRQRHSLSGADIIWTHTESQYLAVAAVLLMTGAKTKLLGQTVWLMDSWKSLSFVKRWLFRRLIERVDVMTFLSGDNYDLARSLFPNADARVVPYGIPSEDTTEVTLRDHRPLRVLSIGNDRHRDWATLVEAVAGHDDMTLLILSGSVSSRLAGAAKNVEVRLARTNEELQKEFAAASVVCVPLRPNLHASGITVIQEAVLAGVPVVASAAGGLTLYFPEDEITYVQPGSPEALRDALLAVARDPQGAAERARRAQARMQDRSSSGAEVYVRRHVEISNELLGR